MRNEAKPPRRTKPIAARNEAKPPRRTKPNHRAERSQSLCETKPISPRRTKPIRRAERSQWLLVIHYERGGYGIESDRRASRMERSFRPTLTRPSIIFSRREREKNSRFPPRNEANLAAPNEANLSAKRSQSRRAERSQSLCETKPISPRRTKPISLRRAESNGCIWSARTHRFRIGAASRNKCALPSYQAAMLPSCGALSLESPRMKQS